MLIDADAVVAKNRDFLLQNQWAMENIELGNASIDVLRSACYLQIPGDDSITMLRLGIRIINSAGAGGTLAQSGYYEPAAAQVRDLVEVGFLLDLFRRDPKQINRWRVCGHDARRRNFSPFELRKILNKLDRQSEAEAKGEEVKQDDAGKAAEDKRDVAYQFFTRHGTHADPETIGLTSPDLQTMVGPFPDRDRVVGLSFELGRYTAAATQYLLTWLLAQDIEQAQQAEEFASFALTFNERLAAFRGRKTDPRK